MAYTRSSPFDQDLAVPVKPLPGLQDGVKLVTMQPGSDEYQFPRTRLVRGRNRVVCGLVEATRAVEAALTALGG